MGGTVTCQTVPHPLFREFRRSFRRSPLVDDTPFAVAFTDGNYTETIAGVEVPLGPIIATLSSSTVANRAELLDTRPWRADQGLPVRFQPAPGVQLHILLACGDKDEPA